MAVEFKIMQITIQNVNVADAVIRNQQPICFYQRPKASDADKNRVVLATGRVFEGGEWRVASNRIYADGGIAWSIVTNRSPDGLVRIPLFPYDVKTTSAEVLVTFGLQMGSLICEQIPLEAKRLLIAQGNVFQLASEATDAHSPAKGYRIWVGFAFELES